MIAARLPIFFAIAAASALLMLFQTLGTRAHADPGPDLEAKLSFRPYSSSYLPYTGGRLSHVQEAAPVFPYAGWIAPKLLAQLQERSTIERMDQARVAVLDASGTKEPLTPRVSKTHYDPTFPSWAGFCNQWSAAASDPEVNRIIRKTEGLICGDALLTKGEIKELFTGFYVTKQREMYGDRYPRKEARERRKWKKLLGFDDLPAHVFHEKLYENLARDQAVILDMESSPEVWNFPVFAAETKFYEFEFDERTPWTFAWPQISHLPSRILEAKDDESREVLKRLQELDSFLERALVSNVTGAEVAAAARPFSFLKRYFGFSPTVKDLIRKRTRLMDSLVKQDLLRLQTGYQVKRARTKLEFAVESTFAATSDFWRQETYEYLLIELDSKLISSAWLTPPRKRPDFMWVPIRANLKDPLLATEQFAYRDALKDLYDLTLRCIDVADIVQLFQTAESAPSDFFADQDRATQFVAALSKVLPVIHADVLKEKLSRFNPPAPGREKL
ncbi:MAG: hypothetical protein A2428_01445 [Bdellovibrionales bacterium RIFOXYC1_FULL_54_43]|nr:MAG: hypothetical protein A2428_01445 [Bdellovibrionales bacterium RIFOXYC1_FULL_54_43]OFZ78942.1 MAG: hypothetical protein A2603_14670 [Bdellovibrionales bacterium RIFOXYD1_FULL_55_31]